MSTRTSKFIKQIYCFNNYFQNYLYIIRKVKPKGIFVKFFTSRISNQFLVDKSVCDVYNTSTHNPFAKNVTEKSCANCKLNPNYYIFINLSATNVKPKSQVFTASVT